MAALAGMVSTQAQMIRVATPQRTADSLRKEPTPTIAPVIVCVVETGTPSADEPKSVAAAAISAAKPPIGLSAVMRMPIVLTMRHPPESVPMPNETYAPTMTHVGISNL